MHPPRSTKRPSGIRLAAVPHPERWRARTRTEVWASLSTDERAALAAMNLSDRERDVVACAIVEQSHKETAETLGLSLHTVKRHARAIAFKAKLDHVSALARHVRASCREAAHTQAQRSAAESGTEHSSYLSRRDVRNTTQGRS